MNVLEKSFDHNYRELEFDYEPGSNVITVRMSSHERQCFTLTLLLEMLDLFSLLDEYGSPYPNEAGNVQYLILTSANPEIFNSGGDLSYFHELVLEQDRDRLMEYGIGCIDLIYWGLTGGKRKITTIAHVAGDALGGGFEAALACNYVFAEDKALFAFPEVVFGFFPGMGGYPLLERFVGINEADKAFNTGKRYSAFELKELGAVYTLCPDDTGMDAIHEFISGRESTRHNHWALQKLKQRNHLIDYELLKYNIELWVDAAMTLTERNLRTMKVLVKRQTSKVKKIN